MTTQLSLFDPPGVMVEIRVTVFGAQLGDPQARPVVACKVHPDREPCLTAMVNGACNGEHYRRCAEFDARLQAFNRARGAA